MQMPTNHDELLGPDVALNIQSLIDDKLLINANSGGGKSHTLRRVIELAWGDAQLLVFDVEGEFHTLRERMAFSLAGPGGEAPATVATAEKLAERLFALGRSAVLDISELAPGQQELFFTKFLGRWMKFPKDQWHDTIVVLDEANKYAPEQKASGTLGDCKAAIVDYARRGRKRGYSLVMATQRIADLDKSAAAECNNVLLGRCAMDVDIERSAKAIGMKRKDAMENFPALKRGEFYAYGAAIVVRGSDGQRVSKIAVGPVDTTHPKRGQRLPITAAPTAVKAALADLHDIADEAVAEEREIDRLRKRVTELEAKTPVNGHTVDRQQHVDKKLYEQALTELNEERAVVSAADTLLKDVSARLEGILSRMSKDRGLPMKGNETTMDHVFAVVRALPVNVATDREAAEALGAWVQPELAKEHTKRPTGGKMRILTVLAQRGSLPVRRLAILSGYTTAQKGFSNYVSALRTSGDIFGKDEVTITTQGLRTLGPWEPLPTGLALLEHYRAELQPAHFKLLRAVWMAHPIMMTARSLAQVTGYDPAQKGFANYISALRTQGLIVGKDQFTTVEDLHK